jgi:hypothetical protein
MKKSTHHYLRDLADVQRLLRDNLSKVDRLALKIYEKKLVREINGALEFDGGFFKRYREILEDLFNYWVTLFRLKPPRVDHSDQVFRLLDELEEQKEALKGADVINLARYRDGRKEKR